MKLKKAVRLMNPRTFARTFAGYWRSDETVDFTFRECTAIVCVGMGTGALLAINIYTWIW